MNVSKVIIAILISIISLSLYSYILLDDLTDLGLSNYSLLNNYGLGEHPFGLIKDNNYIYLLFEHYLVKTHIDSLDNLNYKMSYMYFMETPDSFIVSNEILFALYNNELLIYDVTDISNAIYCSRIISPEDSISCMAIKENYLFLSKYDAGFSIYDLSNPYFPVIKYNYIPKDSSVLSKIVVSDTLVVVCDVDSLLVFDISSLDNPRKSKSISKYQLDNAVSLDFDIYNSILYVSQHGESDIYLFSLEDTLYSFIDRRHPVHNIENLNIYSNNLIVMDSDRRIFTAYYVSDSIPISKHYDYDSYDNNNYCFAIGEFLYRFYPDVGRARLEKADFTYYEYGVMSYFWFSIYGTSSEFNYYNDDYIIADNNTYEYIYNGINFDIDTIAKEPLNVIPYDSFILHTEQDDDTTYIDKYYYDGFHWYSNKYSILPYENAKFVNLDNLLISYYYYYADTNRIIRVYSVGDTLNLIDSIILGANFSVINEMNYCTADSCLYCYNDYYSRRPFKLEIDSDGSIGNIFELNNTTNSLCFTDEYLFMKNASYSYDTWIIAYDISNTDSLIPVDSYYTYSNSVDIDAHNNKLYLCDNQGVYRINVDNVHNPVFEGYIEWEYGQKGNYLIDDQFIFLSGSNNRKIYRFIEFLNVDNNISNPKSLTNNLFCSSGILNLDPYISDGTNYFEIYDLNGRLILKGFINPSMAEINLSKISNGVYFVSISGPYISSKIKLTLLK